ncbi:Lrp/AsnC family transcriptional regulator [Corynebacterium neomassiliense]|uniref:Lrp/AsnC family transcriptional regulator n=1 Tax=Corynebacterium neomassiliense TaxID=2079482 RepID=UPI001030EC05|nr:Lrp/AsnC family transcriptional regulator [Corynebacterium neomassiliense]
MTSDAGQGTPVIDQTDHRILEALDEHPRASVAYLAESLHLARGTVRTRLTRLTAPDGPLAPVTARLVPASVGRPLRAIVTAEADQETFDGMIDDLTRIPEVVECLGISGRSDMSIEVVAVDADDLYRITQAIMRCRGIRRTETGIVMRELIPRRMGQLTSGK